MIAMKKAKFITLAASLGIAVPACLLGISQDSQATVAKTPLIPQNSKVIKLDVKNPIKEKIINNYNVNEQTPAFELVHSNVHANYTISHTDVHTDFNVGRHHTDQHGNTPAHHVDSHHNARI